MTVYGWRHEVSYAIIDNANFDIEKEVRRIGTYEYRRVAMMYGWPKELEPTWSVEELDEPERQVEFEGETITLPPLKARVYRWEVEV